MTLRSAVFYILMFCMIQACKSEKQNRQEIIAVIRGHEITVEEFREFYELDPNFGLDSSGTDALRDELRFYAGQKLAFEKAMSDHLVEDPVFKRAIAWEKRQAMLRQLFRYAIMSQVTVTENELADYFIKQNTMVHVRHLFFPDMEAAIEAKKRLESGTPFTQIAAEIFTDTTLANNGGDLGWMRLGDLDEDFGGGIYALESMEESAPVRSRWGYHIVQLLDRREQKILKEDQFSAQKKSLEKKIRQKKMQDLSGRYVRSIMAERNPQPVQRMFRLFWQAIVPYEQREMQQLKNRQMLSAGLLEQARNRLSAELDDALIVYRNGEVTLREFLDAMQEIPEGQRPRFASMRELSDQMAVWMRDEILFREAAARGLDRHERVLHETLRFSEEQSYYYYLNEIADSLLVPDSVEVYFRTRKGAGVATEQRWRRFHTIQEWKWNEAGKRLQENLYSTGPEPVIDERLLQKESERVNWERRIPMFMVRKPQ